MQCYTEILPPTAVTHAVSLPFLHAGANNLVVAKASVLQVFELKTITTDVSRVAGKEKEQKDEKEKHSVEGQDAFHRTENTTKLVLIGEYPLSGTITSLARVRTLSTKTGGEALLVATKDAKVSLVDWDPENYRIATISIHYYEGDKIQSQPFGPGLGDCDTYLTVDPSSRCAALRLGVRHLAILPFRQPGDELAGDDYDPDLDPAPAPVPASKADAIGANTETLYKPSFVLPLTAIDPALTHPVHMAFLHEYREPTFGIVSANKAASHAVLDERKDLLTYTVFTLDLEQRASTALLSVSGLPFDIFRVIPLPLPVGGALLVGANEMVHVDQSGKTVAVAVNEFARLCSDFPMSDQSDLGLRLEACQIEPLDPANADMMVVLKSGEIAILSFHLDGRSMSGLSLRLVDDFYGGNIINSTASCVAGLGRGKIFIGSEDGDSLLLGWFKKSAQSSRKRSHAQMLAEEAEIELDEEDLDDADDDLYADETPAAKQTSAAAEPSAPGSYAFRIHDSLFSIAPIMDMCVGKAQSSLQDDAPSLTILAAVGRSRCSRLAKINRELTPHPSRSINIAQVQYVWSACAKHASPRGLPKPQKGEQNPESQLAADNLYDQYLITSNIDENGEGISKVFQIDNTVTETQGEDSPTKYTAVTGTEFEGDAETLDVGMLASGTRIVQVRKHEVRTYDADLGLSQIYPILNEATDEEIAVLHTSFCDPYLLIIRQDLSLQVLAVDKSGDLDEVERGDAVLEQKWLSGSLYQSEMTNHVPLAFLLGDDGSLKIYELPNLDQPIYSAPQLSFLPPVLSTDNTPRRATGKATLKELVFADLGDATFKSPYLILRSATDDLTIYEPFRHPDTPPTPFTTNLRFRKVPGLQLPKYNTDESLAKAGAMRALPNVGGYATVFLPGASSSFVMRNASSLPHVVPLRGKGVRGLCGLNSRHREAGFAYVDQSGSLHEAQLPANAQFCANGWTVVKHSPFSADHEIRHVAYHTEADLYVVVTRELVDFVAPDDDPRHPAAEEEITLRPKASRFYVHLYNPHVNLVVSTMPLPAYEIVTSMEVMPLEISEVTHKHKLLVAVGTISERGENYAARGALYTLDVVDVVPEPDKPETGKKLHQRGREDTKGGITAIMGIAGLVGTAQGQKMMIRGLREDGSCLPVAFLDAQCYMASLKTLGNTKLWLAADAWKGVWFGGFGEEPYRISLFGKSRSHMEVVEADFLPFEGQLYLVVIDANMDMHVLQYDPEHPKSLAGQRLLHRSTFHTGHLPTKTLLLPSTLSSSSIQADQEDTQMPDHDSRSSSSPDPQQQQNQSAAAPNHHILISSLSGSLSLLTPLPEPLYRRLSALQTTLSSILEHPLGLNPRAYRAVESTSGSNSDVGGGAGSIGSRSVVDGDLIVRIGELGAGKRAEVLGRVGYDDVDDEGDGSGGGDGEGARIGWRRDLEELVGRGLGYL
ncbi:hypothetical protein AAFC00_007041 [Neodothiora populina]|uniref:Protein CFT1 n=1 Tax=Neodothiora populina TaxID=2781224 RepID=A0ABR3PC00_9PEZI